MSGARYKIGEFSKKIGVAVVTLQSWDRSGKLKANRTISGRRYYTDEHLKNLEELERRKQSNGRAQDVCKDHY